MEKQSYFEGPTMTVNDINSSKPAQITGELKRKLVILSAIFAVVYVIIVTIPALTIVPVDWFLERMRGVTFVDSWTPGTMAYSALIVLLPLVYLVTAAVLFTKNRRNR